MDEAQAARDVKLHDRFVGTPYEHAVIAQQMADGVQSRFHEASDKVHISPRRKTTTSGLPYGLSQKEYDILILIFKGYSWKEAAKAINRQPSTVRTHMHNIYGKMGVSGGITAVVKWVREYGLPAELDQGDGMEGAPHDG